MKDKCKWEKEDISPSIPSVVFVRCKHPDIKGTTNCIGHEDCADYEESED